MHRRDVLATLAVVPAMIELDMSGPVTTSTANAAQNAPAASEPPVKLTPPANGTIDVAVLLSDRATVIDFCGPWEVFQDVAIGGPHGAPNHRMPFRLYTVAESRDPITTTGGMRILPQYTFDDVPAPRVIVIPAQAGRSERLLNWVRQASQSADLTLSVCTGAFLLAATGLLKGRAATTHHDFYDRFAAQYPDVELRRGLRYVEQGKLMSAGGLSSGIDAALRVVERYFGRETAQQTARYMEYQGTGWMS
jgi:transcriptional regulator GlxA family with amidase domain